MPAQIHALIPASGRGARFGGVLPKQFREVLGRPLLWWSVLRLREAGVQRFVVAVPGDLLELAAQALAGLSGVRLVAGGATRQASVRCCLDACEGGSDELVLVHDAARCAVDPEDVVATILEARNGGAAILGRPVTDTIKRVVDGHIVATEDREQLFRAETPQVFVRRLLEEGYRRVGEIEATDESALVERIGAIAIRAVVARQPNPKVTWEGDLVLVESLLQQVEPA